MRGEYLGIKLFSLIVFFVSIIQVALILHDSTSAWTVAPTVSLICLTIYAALGGFDD